MAEKTMHLHELLQDDQEPFHLNHYIADLRSQMGYSDFRVKKRKLRNATVLPPGLFSCERSCFFATRNKSLDPGKSPLFERRSPEKKKPRDSHVFFQIPASTAAILLEAASRIQKQRSEKVNKTNNKTRNRGNGFGLFSSILKRLTNRTSKPRLDTANANAISSERGSESTSSSSRRERFVEIGGKCFCESPFHFVLQTTPYSDHRTPHFTSTATSPSRRSTENEDGDETESLEKVRGHEEEEDKEQCSPISVLDPLDQEEDEEDHHQREPDDLNLLSCSFEVVQRAKRRLLKKIRRFEKLAGLDPVKLQGKMSKEEEEEDEESKEEEYEESKEEEYEESEEDDNVRAYDLDEEYENVDEAMARERGCAEEERRKKNDEKQKKWRMMNAWRVGLGAEEVMNAVVWKDTREEAGEWTRHGGEVEEAVSDLELSIFFCLIDEFSHELVSSSP